MAWQCNVSDQQVAEIMGQLDIKGDLQVDLIYQANGSLKVVKQGENASITYGTRAELFRGLGLLAQHSGEENYAAEQKARFALNGAMLDCSRNGVVNLNAAKQMVRYLALMGHNMLMLYTEDTYEVPEYPYFGYMRGRYTQKELQELDAYAKGYGVELIPCMQTLPEIAERLETFRAAVEVRWLTEYKVSGYDVLDFRIGGISARIQNAIRRISAYLNGEISKIEELEGERLSFNCLTEEELQKDPVLCWNIRAHQYSANNI